MLPCVNKVYEVQVTEFMDARLSDAITAYRTKNSCETLQHLRDLRNLSKGDQRENHYEFNENFNEITDEEV